MSEVYRDKITMTAYGTNNHLLNGQPIAGPVAGVRRFRAAVQATTATTYLTVQVGNRFVVNNLKIGLKNAEPIEPDDFHYSWLAGPGEIVVINLRNSANDTPDVYVVVKADTLAVRRR